MYAITMAKLKINLTRQRSDNYSGEVLYVTSNTKNTTSNTKNNFIYSVFLNYEISRRYIVLIFSKGSFKSNEYYNPDKSSE